tara:strand:+ start:947 stop:1360 length:414 start_codon:yes stop_codon:yes gene_type:complete
MKYKVVGLREELYIGKEVSGHNCDFEYTDTEMTKHVILLVSDEDKTKVELTLEEVQGECGSGWCTASYGEYKWDLVTTFAGKTHKPIEVTYINLKVGDLDTDEGSISNGVFYFSEYGGCCYYPSGGYNITEDMFTPI